MSNGFVWYELMTPDRPAAARFYADVVGWRVEERTDVGMPYSLLTMDGRQMAGVMDMPQGAGTTPMWFGYIGVDDVDEAAEKAVAAGASIHNGPGEIPNVGRFAVMADPQGAMFMLFASTQEAMPPLPYMAPGTVGWHELHTRGWAQAWDFYAGQFGWEKSTSLEMGGMGTYQMFTIRRDMAEGAMLDEPGWPTPYWLYYFAVPGIAEAKARLEAGGGSVVHGPIEVPGGGWIVLAKDPQGGMFALVGPEKEDAR